MTNSYGTISEEYEYQKEEQKDREVTILDTLKSYKKWEIVKLPLWSEIFDDFKIVWYNKKDDTFTVERVISNWKVVKKVKKEILDYYNNRGYTVWEEIFIKIEGKYLKGKVISFNDEKLSYSVEWEDESGTKREYFSVKELDYYNNNYIHPIVTNKYYFPDGEEYSDKIN